MVHLCVTVDFNNQKPLRSNGSADRELLPGGIFFALIYVLKHFTVCSSSKELLSLKATAKAGDSGENCFLDLVATVFHQIVVILYCTYNPK